MKVIQIGIVAMMVVLIGCASDEGIRESKPSRGPLPADQNKCFATCPSMKMTPVYDTSTGSCTCKPN